MEALHHRVDTLYQAAQNQAGETDGAEAVQVRKDSGTRARKNHVYGTHGGMMYLALIVISLVMLYVQIGIFSALFDIKKMLNRYIK